MLITQDQNLIPFGHFYGYDGWLPSLAGLGALNFKEIVRFNVEVLRFEIRAGA
ncbi:MAG: hypothetical protein AAFY78_06565 [Cyanobacteria bacterium J06648_16]